MYTSSQISGTVLLSVPAEIYKFGAVYWWTCIAILVNSLVSTYVFMPVFMKLQLTSTYEYLKVRFDNKIRIFASFLAVLWILLYNPIVVYIPAVAFAQGKLLSQKYYRISNKFIFSYRNQFAPDNSSNMCCLYILHNHWRLEKCCLGGHFANHSYRWFHDSSILLRNFFSWWSCERLGKIS